MNEKLLSFIWKHQYFNRQSLSTSQGDPLEVIHPGELNSNQGPDFSEARLKISDTTWVGNIELHVLASDWKRHHHDEDQNYRNIILHVVWINDGHAHSQNIPVLELEPRVSVFLLRQYQEMMHQVRFIACEKQILGVDGSTLASCKEKMLTERLERKAAQAIGILQQTNYHWEETLWRMLAKNFGGKLNGEAFQKMAQSIPLAILGRHKHQLQQVEALLFGQSGLLDQHFTEAYPKMLKKEYKFLMKKYNLPQPLIAFQYLRMRPINFPTIRLAQLAVLISKSNHLFSKIRETNSLGELCDLLSVTANDYWHYHYHFDEPGNYLVKNLGKDMLNNLFINTIIPLLYAFGKYQKDSRLLSRAVSWLNETEAENNGLLDGWRKLGLTIENASDSQAFIELKTNYCEKKKCLECVIGKELLNF